MHSILKNPQARKALLTIAQKNSYICPTVLQQQLKNYQSKFAPNSKVSLIDSLSLVYEDSKYQLDLRPWEYRDKQYDTYVLFGGIAASIPGLLVIFLMFFSLAWYTFNDTEVAHGWLHDNHPFFNIHSGGDLHKHPIFHPTLMVSPQKLSSDRHWFYQEIEQAIKTRKAEKLGH